MYNKTIRTYVHAYKIQSSGFHSDSLPELCIGKVTHVTLESSLNRKWGCWGFTWRDWSEAWVQWVGWRGLVQNSNNLHWSFNCPLDWIWRRVWLWWNATVAPLRL